MFGKLTPQEFIFQERKEGEKENYVVFSFLPFFLPSYFPLFFFSISLSLLFLVWYDTSYTH